MRPDEVPSESAAIFEGGHKAVYVVDADGRYRIAQSGGAEAEVTVTEAAVAWFDKLAADALARARRGEASPLEYHMFRQRMDPPTLAQSTGLWLWRVRRHLRPAHFARLSPALLARYADALDVPPDDLPRLPPTLGSQRPASDS
jgi:hypothetical protein